jgi:ATP-binding cassette, subfamily C, bacterial CydC
MSGLRTAAWLVSFLHPFARLTVLSVVLGTAAVAVGVGLLGTSAHLIATAALHPSVAVLQVAIVGVRFFGIARSVLRYLERLVSHSVNFHLLARLRLWFYNAVEPLAPARLLDYRSGDLLSRAVGDIETLENFYVRAVAPPLSAVLVTVGVSLFLGRYDARLGFVLAGALVVSGAGLPLLAHLLGRSPGQAVVERRAALNNAVVDTVQGMGDLLAFGQAPASIKKALAAGQALGKAQVRVGRVGALVNALGLLLSGLALGGVLVIGIPLVGSRIDGVALAVLVLVTLASFEAVTPLPLAAQHLQSSLAAGARLFELADQTPAVLLPAQPLAQPITCDFGTPPAHPGPSAHILGASLQIRGLTFHYAPDLPPALADISLDVASGQHIALVGPSGAGKSTLFALLLRLWEYQAGEIWLDGHDLRDFDPEALRRSLAVVPQANYLFAGTLRQNLVLCAPEAGSDAVEKTVRQAGLAAWTAQLPQGLETRVGERGLQISGGERRRVVLARALLAASGRARLLLLDEPTAHLDAVTERRFLTDLTAAARGRSLVLITHSLTGLDAVDEVVVLENGRIAERGHHADLIRAGGLYARMWKIHTQVL